MSKIKYVLSTLNVILFVGLTAAFVSMYFEVIAISDTEQRQLVRHNDDVASCRMRLGIGIDDDRSSRELAISFRSMMMACAAAVQANRPAVGEMRLTLAQKAWDQCMPKLDVCDRALTEDKR